MMDDSHDKLPELPLLGSTYRLGREEPAYQLSRLRTLCAFTAHMAGVHARYLRQVQKKAAEVWRGSRWLDQQRTRWMNLAEERERLLSEQRAWTSELEKGKAWLESRWQECRELAERQEQMVNQQKALIAQLQSRIDGASDQVSDD